MSRIFSFTLALALASAATVGCSEKAKSSRETTVSTPGGKTTVTETREVEKSGDNPPAATK